MDVKVSVGKVVVIMLAFPDFYLCGDCVTLVNGPGMNEIRKALRDDKVIGIVAEDSVPFGSVLVWDEVAL